MLEAFTLVLLRIAEESDEKQAVLVSQCIIRLVPKCESEEGRAGPKKTSFYLHVLASNMH